jgi:hypothetical protein
MLFTDTILSTVDQLAEYESEIRGVASAEAINLDTKLRLAQNELGIELLATSVLPDTNRTRNAFTLSQVVVTDALRLWHIFHTLSTVFRDAYNRKVNDKYLPKWTEYQNLAKAASGQYLTIGVALVLDPLPAPSAAALSGVAGGALDPANYYVQTTWVNAAGHESGPSPESGKALAGGQLLVVQPGSAPAKAVGWLPYVATAAGQELRQIYPPLDVSTPWIMPLSGLVSGPGVPPGQSPDVLRTLPRTLQRG